ncbi:DUF6773 family protein [Alkalihalophilus lindianensis]|uniref:DUF6773 family protein n=1 Tax=Alkalihalophilus lindianensis TaxID=1630542 RepID=A0ABU3XF42_9BACI|nr:DUF6773 family protein [Alkalihalophilus lindianensis]MDV2686458.1 DUF6773 family protein [Alkalihalophilus lindianensis]
MALWKKKPVDERVTNMQNKIYREIYHLVMLIALVSVVVKFMTIEVTMQVVLTEFLILLGASIYYLVRATTLGIYSDEVELHDTHSKMKRSKKNFYGGLAFGVIFALIFATNSAINYAEGTQQAINYFALVFGVSLIIYAPFFILFIWVTHTAAKKKSDQINQQQLDEDEGK